MNLPLSQCDGTTAAELRAETRTHLFVVAMLSAGTVLMPVHIRNLSSSGALIEASALPSAGSVVSIRRAGHTVEGILAWRSKNQAGIAFRSNIYVPAWLPRNAGSRQYAIDQIVFASKNGTESASDLPLSNGAPATSNLVLVELESLRSDLVSLGEMLVQDIILVATHPEIQLLDIAVQRIDRLMSLTSASRASHKRKKA